MKELVLATSNPGKVKELQALLDPIRCLPQSDFTSECADETGLTFLENALIKARFASQISNKPALADDSGLVVAALGGAPGIYSARYAGVGASSETHIQKLLTDLSDQPDSERDACFYCAIAFVQHARDPMPLFAVGRLDGRIAQEPQGEQGFGYDSVFFLPSVQLTMAQIPAEQKNTISHRAQALQHLLANGLLS